MVEPIEGQALPPARTVPSEQVPGLFASSEPNPPGFPVLRQPPVVRVTEPVLPGSLVLISDTAVPSTDGMLDESNQSVETFLREAMAAIEKACGHRQFLVMLVPSTEAVQVAGPDEQAAWVRELIASAVPKPAPDHLSWPAMP